MVQVSRPARKHSGGLESHIKKSSPDDNAGQETSRYEFLVWRLETSFIKNYKIIKGNGTESTAFSYSSKNRLIAQSLFSILFSKEFTKDAHTNLSYIINSTSVAISV